MVGSMHKPIYIPERPARLHNRRCAYCGVDLATVTKTFDHVIGRRFVPKGQLHKEWNVMLGACDPCNSKKADLENDISAITVQPDAGGRFPDDDPVLRDAARTKGWGSKSNLTGKRVGDSMSSLSGKVPLFPGATATFNFTGPPQVSQDRLFTLCRMQIEGFFHFLTYRQGERLGGYIPGGFYPLLEARRSDWGNVAHKWFMREVGAWEIRLVGPLATGYAKVAIRRLLSADCWSWALEWNKTFRIVGFMGDRDATDALLKSCPPLPRTRMDLGPKRWIAVRTDVPLEERDDTLFAVPGDLDVPAGL